MFITKVVQYGINRGYKLLIPNLGIISIKIIATGVSIRTDIKLKIHTSIGMCILAKYVSRLRYLNITNFEIRIHIPIKNLLKKRKYL
ncbi:hypothetical protein [uncultured Aquimarina sp.]|uniref:hypothetical protein n=1 Tax=uncultured Aquimarina sp. TaxID=575652 RepID=UPI00262A6F5F|nr:hypothetical protein [uncultured Aquimarina sp.]